ncbi:hypothetical protein [Sulfurimonas sp.]|uniref:hypothetical protein n=1 Tax=Sulfurimonas sp. TaxID=2022749 RepID=UPI0025D84A90|nr:hypothetical protein [Sulfurimonas sp.]MCK9455649.1 hypothetical protein [Sulfurimonas sp.]
MLDVINVIYILTIFLIIDKYYSINRLYLLILILHIFSIFLFNGFLFDPNYMPDQFKYLNVAQNIREFDFFNDDNFGNGYTVYFSGVFFGLFPIPFIDSLYSIGMINFLLYLFIFLFMYKKGFLHSKLIAYFYLLYPSLILYSSVALRDMLVFSVMFFGIYFMLFTKKYIFAFGILLLLKFIKFQNLLIFVVSFLLSSLISSKNRLKYLLSASLMLVVVYFMFSDFFTIERLNFYRWAFYNENLSDVTDTFIPLNSFGDVLFSAVPSAVKMFFRPLPWMEAGTFQLAQFLENVGVFCIIMYILYLNTKYKIWNLQKVKFLNVLLLLSLVIYGLVSYNSGTAVRYKFPFVTIYIVYSLYFIYQTKQLYKKSVECAE